MKSPILRPAASADLEEAYAWYEGQRRGLGDEFRDEVDAAFAMILENPHACAVLHRDTRRAVLRRFPYCVFYRIVEDDIIVVACLHGKRNPRLWRKRR